MKYAKYSNDEHTFLVYNVNRFLEFQQNFSQLQIEKNEGKYMIYKPLQKIFHFVLKEYL